MRRLDFELVAQAMNDAKPRPHTGGTDQWRVCCVSLADAFEKQNGAFDRPRFLSNCGCIERTFRGPEWTGPPPRS